LVYSGCLVCSGGVRVISVICAFSQVNVVDDDCFSSFIYLVDDSVFSDSIFPEPLEFTDQFETQIRILRQLFNASSHAEFDIARESTKLLEKYVKEDDGIAQVERTFRIALVPFAVMYFPLRNSRSPVFILRIVFWSSVTSSVSRTSANRSDAS